MLLRLAVRAEPLASFGERMQPAGFEMAHGPPLAVVRRPTLRALLEVVISCGCACASKGFDGREDRWIGVRSWAIVALRSSQRVQRWGALLLNGHSEAMAGAALCGVAAAFPDVRGRCALPVVYRHRHAYRRAKPPEV